MEPTDRFADPGDTIYSLMAGEVLIQCPRCAGCASHKPQSLDSNNRDWFARRRLICTHCGLTRDWAEKSISRQWLATPARDDYFGEILWIRGSFGAYEIWAYNWPHLDLIESYVAAKLRSHVRHPEYGWTNASFVNRLPTWLTSSKNRNDVLATIDRIRRARLG